MPGPVNGIIGEEALGNLPESKPDERALNEERQAAQYAQHPEFKRIVAHMEARKDFYRNQMPGGEAVQNLEELGRRWLVSAAIIAEFDQIINFYKEAEEIVKEADQGK